MSHKEWRWVAWVTLALLVASSLPYLFAWAVTPEGAHFAGLVFNPQDGNSYIAKMRQGFNGSWLFRLPYTPEPHNGAPVYLFYLLLGHLARWTGLPLIAVYHAARALGGAAMLISLYVLASRLSDDVGELSDSAQDKRRAVFLLTALGSGLGWLAGTLGHLTPDLWIPEAFPAYALLANAHFPWALALMAGIAYCGLRIANGEWRMGSGDQQSAISDRRSWLWGLGMVVLAAVLGAVQPFGLVAVFGGMGVMLAARAARERRVTWRAAVWVVVAGALALFYPLYMQAAIRADPVLATWNAQNATPSPAPWDWALGYGLVLVLAAVGIGHGFHGFTRVKSGNDDLRSRCEPVSQDGFWLLVGWVAVAVVGMYLPLPLQRRLSLGLGVPLGLLAGMGWGWLRARIKARRRGLAQGLVVAFCALTPLFLVLMMLLAALGGSPRFYLSGDEWAALVWLRDQGRPDAVVLCSPQMGLFVPAWAGQPVVYGHPFETVNAAQRKAQVEEYWAGEVTAEEQRMFLRENHVGYVLEVGSWKLEVGELVFEAGDVRVYEVR